MATAARHQEISDTFLQHAEEEFEKGDLLQASEKAWGALAHYVKSVAKERGWPNRSHRDLRDNAAILIRYTSDPGQSRGMFLAIDALHTNFYEEHYEEETVWRGIECAGALIRALKSAETAFPRERPEVMLGKPVIKGTRLTVEHMVGLLAHGMTADQVIDEFEIEREDLQASLLFATRFP